MLREDPSALKRALDLLPTDGMAPASALASIEPKPATVRIGDYELRSVLGEGGFGVVWLATQAEPLQRSVALKVLRPDRLDPTSRARFDAERRLLALLDHPSLVKVFDAGETPDGRPWFTMELAQGAPITEAADAARLGVDERLRLLAQVARAVHHAHAHGLVHRDLKPANILVEGADGRLVPRIIDFGVARAMDGRHVRLTPESIAHRLGTPDYMAPEQWEYGIGACEKPSDVFALGIVLGELACGVLPRDGAPVKSRGQRPAPPLAPSKALLRLAATDAARARDLAARRGFADVDACARAIAARIDPIFVKATAAEAPARYADAGAMRATLAQRLTSVIAWNGRPSRRNFRSKLVPTSSPSRALCGRANSRRSKRLCARSACSTSHAQSSSWSVTMRSSPSGARMRWNSRSVWSCTTRRLWWRVFGQGSLK